ncbi:MAG: TRAP transporter substrate-binding protein DctP [Synergistaceae bacterium]|nr:TRAP transporter substrate-binding protein DctP [Synergistaceae bacterium]
MRIWGKVGAVLVIAGLVVAGWTFFKVSTQHGTGVRVIRMAHNQQNGTEIADTIAMFAKFVEEDPSQKLAVQIYPSGILGSENEAIEMVQAGILDMAKVGSQTLSQFDPKYSIFSVPYLFVGQEHYYTAMEKSGEVQKLFDSTAGQGFIAIGYYANGARNFYMVDDICVDSPAKLSGKKIRSMPSATSMEMIRALGGSPVPMSASESYTALQQGVVDGAENTELVLTVNGHEDLVKAYTYTEHQYSPDIYIFSIKLWNSLTDAQKAHLRASLAKTNDNFKKKYNDMMAGAIAEAQEHGVTIYRGIDKTSLIEAVKSIAEEFMSRGEDYRKLFEDIQSYANAK